MTTNRSMPPGAIIPELPYPDVLEAADWLSRAFGFKKRLQIANHRVQLTFGINSLVVIERGGSPASSFHVMVHVEDVDGRFERAKAAGARVIDPPADHPFGERQCVLEDIGGHRWTFSQSIADVDPRSWGGVLFE